MARPSSATLTNVSWDLLAEIPESHQKTRILSALGIYLDCRPLSGVSSECALGGFVFSIEDLTANATVEVDTEAYYIVHKKRTWRFARNTQDSALLRWWLEAKGYTLCNTVGTASFSAAVERARAAAS